MAGGFMGKVLWVDLSRGPGAFAPHLPWMHPDDLMKRTLQPKAAPSHLAIAVALGLMFLAAPAIAGDKGVRTHKWPNGNRYTGQWDNDKMHGQGTHWWKQAGMKYIGQWRYNKMHGQGTKTWADGRKYVGAFADNRQDGRGKMTWKSGDSYDGQWRKDEMDGQGTYRTSAGDTYVGAWRMGKTHGKGKRSMASKIVYDGHWQADLKHGHGRQTWRDGQIGRASCRERV